MTNYWAEFALCFISLFSVANPFSAIPPFVGLTTDIPSPERNRITRQTGLAVFIILTVSYLAGEGLLRLFSVIGVVADVQVLVLGVDDLPREALYLSALQKPMHSGHLLLLGEQSADDTVYAEWRLAGFHPESRAR